MLRFTGLLIMFPSKIDFFFDISNILLEKRINDPKHYCNIVRLVLNYYWKIEICIGRPPTALLKTDDLAFFTCLFYLKDHLRIIGKKADKTKDKRTKTKG